jgi:hypothetical protein
LQVTGRCTAGTNRKRRRRRSRSTSLPVFTGGGAWGPRAATIPAPRSLRHCSPVATLFLILF